MAKATEILKDVLAKCGYPAAEIAKITGDEIPDEVANQIKGLTVFTKESALANPDIRKVIRAEALDGVDADLERLMGVHGLSDEEKAEIKKLDKTNLKIENFATKIKALTEKAASATGKNKTDLENQIVKLNESFAAERLTWDQKFTDQEKARLNDKVEWSVENIYAGLNYANKDLPKEVNVLTAKTLMNNYANSKGATFTMTEKGLALVTKDGQPYYENNVSPTPQDFITKALNENKFLAVSNPAEKGNQNFQSQNPNRGKEQNSQRTVNFKLLDAAEAELGAK